MFGFGALIGVISINFISDYRGRKFAFMLAIFVSILANLGIFAIKQLF